MRRVLIFIVFAVLGYVSMRVLTSPNGLNFNLLSLLSFSKGSGAPVPTNNIDPAEKLAAKKLVPTKDKVQIEIERFSGVMRQAFLDRKFAALEKAAAELRKTRALFDDGKWKLKVFYEAMNEVPPGSPDHIWQRDLAIYETWKSQYPDSITARTGQMGLLASYAWKARGAKYAIETPKDSMALMKVRLDQAKAVFMETRGLKEKDPCCQLAALRIALGQNWRPEDFDKLVAEALAFDPTFYPVFNLRSYSLMPQWHGSPGEWEKYATKATQNTGGLGDEAYARVMMNLCGHFNSIFAKSNASWPKTRKGLMILRKKYPDSFEILCFTAYFATLGDDRKLAKECFDLIGDRQCVEVWSNPKHMVHFRTYAHTGLW